MPVAECNHTYSPECPDCSSDATYKWITCPRYKLDCPDFVCLKCGEFESVIGRQQ